MNDHHHDEDLQVPPRLGKALRSVQKQHLFVPPQLDEKILQQARGHINSQRNTIFLLPRWAAIAACFVAAGLAVGLYFSPGKVKYVAEDINRDGVVDILDAFALAQKIKAGKTVAADFNGDGRVDELDVKWIAQKAVQLADSESEEHSAATLPGAPSANSDPSLVSDGIAWLYPATREFPVWLADGSEKIGGGL